MASPNQSVDDAALTDFKVHPPGKMTEEEFVAWCDEDTRAEWVDGEVVMMSPANLEHTLIAHWLASVLSGFAEHHDAGVVLPDFQIRMPRQRRRRNPDIVYVSKDRLETVKTTCVEGTPDLIVEIVSPDSQARDWREKYLEYEAAGVREYWVVDPLSQRAEFYALTAESAPGDAATPAGRYRRLEENEGTVISSVLPGLALRVEWLWPQSRPKALEALRQLGVLGPVEK